MEKKKELVPFSGFVGSRMRELDRFSNMISNVFDGLWDGWDLDHKFFTDIQPKSNFPKINCSETGTGYEVEIALAGFSKDDVSLSLDGDCLVIKADKKEEACSEDKKYLMKEISSRSFRRALMFPMPIDKNEIDCSFKDGIVKCVFKKEIVEPKDDILKIDIK